MLREIRLSNFRAFDREAVLRVRPITVLIGKNNAGKSSLIKFILMLQQSLDPASANFLNSEGGRVNLGAFLGLRNSRSRSRDLQFFIRFETFDAPSPSEISNMSGLLQSAKVRQSTSPIHGAKVFVSESMTSEESESTVRERMATYELRSRVRYGRGTHWGRQEIEASIGGERQFRGTSANVRRGGLLSFPPEGDTYAALVGAFVSERFLQPIRYELSSIRHLGPMRVESQHAIVTSSPPVDDVGQRGEFALPHLQDIINSNDERAAFVMKHVAAVAGIEKLRFERTASNYVVHAQAQNRETKAWAYLADFGFGVSQCIPVFVQGALMPPSHLLMVEQPEAQLHPTAQLDMGEFFANLWTERGVASLVETHSSNIILRMRRLIARKKLNHSDVSIAYVTTEKGLTTIKNLDISPDGSLESGLPMEFFGADIIEGIKLGAKR